MSVLLAVKLNLNSMTKTKTISLQGKEYAQVKERVKEFRQDCPNGKIETSPTIQQDGQIIFKALVVKDKKDEYLAEATGHSMGANKGIKAFEKLETIAVGRALAMLGYAQDGEIASGEEMEEFQIYKEEKKEKEIEENSKKLREAKDLDELKVVWASLTAEMKKELGLVKDEIKKTYENS